MRGTLHDVLKLLYVLLKHDLKLYVLLKHDLKLLLRAARTTLKIEHLVKESF